MSNPILSDSAQSGNSYPAPKGPPPLIKTRNEILQDWIEDTAYAIQALQTWLAYLKRWQSQDRVPRKEFDRAYAVIDDATLSEWAWVGLVELRIAINGEEAE
jgi:hypothetical protein